MRRDGKRAERPWRRQSSSSAIDPAAVFQEPQRRQLNDSEDWRIAWEGAGDPARLPADGGEEHRAAGGPRSVAMKITGHRTKAVCRRYAIVSVAELRKAATKLAGLAIGAPRAPRGQKGGDRS